MLTVDGDSVRLFHQTLMEFLMQASSPYFVNPGQGAARLLSLVSEDAAYARLDPPLKMFCQQNFEDWILQCRDLKDYSFNLTQLYDQFCFSRPTEALPYYVCGVNVSERDRQVVEHLMNTGLAESTVSIIALAFTRATERFRSGGPELWIREPGRLAPDEVTARAISRGINMSFEFAPKVSLGRSFSVGLRRRCAPAFFKSSKTTMLQGCTGCSDGLTLPSAIMCLGFPVILKIRQARSAATGQILKMSCSRKVRPLERPYAGVRKGAPITPVATSLEHKCPGASRELRWQFVFPSAVLRPDVSRGRSLPWHLHYAVLDRTVKQAADAASLRSYSAIRVCWPWAWKSSMRSGVS